MAVQTPNMDMPTASFNPNVISPNDLYLAVPVAAAVIIGITVAVTILLKNKQPDVEESEDSEEDFEFD